MYYDEFENYYEPSKAGLIINAAAEELKGVLTEEAVLEINMLKNENERLTNELIKYKEAEREINERKWRLEQKEKTLERDFIKGKFEDIIKPFIQNDVLYIVDRYSKLIPKCNKCNDDREVEYTSEYGDTIKSKCSCDKYKTFYYPLVKELKSIEFAKGRNDFMATPRYSKSYEYEYFYVDFNRPPIEEYVEDVFEDVCCDNKNYFSNKDICQMYCDSMNKKQGWEVE